MMNHMRIALRCGRHGESGHSRSCGLREGFEDGRGRRGARAREWSRLEMWTTSGWSCEHFGVVNVELKSTIDRARGLFFPGAEHAENSHELGGSAASPRIVGSGPAS